MDRHFARERPIKGTAEAGTYWIGAAIGAGSGILTGLMNKSAAEDAADAQRDALEQQMALQREMYQQQRADQAPWREAGGRSIGRMEYLLGLGDAPGTQRDTTQTTQIANPERAAIQAELGQLEPLIGGRGGINYDVGAEGMGSATPEQVARAQQLRAQLAGMPETIAQTTGGVETVPGEVGDPEFGSFDRNFSEADFRADPGYQFRMDEGEKALNRAAAARGMWQNPATVKELQRFSGGLADQTYGDAFSRHQAETSNRFNRLASLAGMGQQAANQTSNAAQNFANYGGNTLANMGAAQSAGILGGANALSQGIGAAGAGFGNQAAFNQGLGLLGGGQAGGGFNLGGSIGQKPVTAFGYGR